MRAPATTTLAYGAGQLARLGWYLGHYGATRRWFARIENAPRRRTVRGRLAGARIQAALLRGALTLLRDDLANVRAGVYPLPGDLAPRPLGAAMDAARYWCDLPRVALRRRRRVGRETTTGDPRYPEYYQQNFHYQSGGWLTEESAALYDTQVEILFGGMAAPMRRQGLAAISERVAAAGPANGAGMRLLDLGTGTGAMLVAVAEAFPGLALDGLDLSTAYLDRARRRLSGHDVRWHAAPAETIPLPDASVDVVTAVYLFHELPAEIRTAVLAEAARVLKPGGRLVLIDSLQLGDEPVLDPVLRSFPDQFHEPYYRSWIEADVPELFAAAGLKLVESRPVYLSKVFVADRE